MGSRACGAVRKWDFGTLTLARGRGRTLQSPRHGEESSRVGPLHAHLGRDTCLSCAGVPALVGRFAAALHVSGYIGASGYRVLLAGQETERDAYGLGQASKVYGTFLPGVLRQQGGREEGAGEGSSHRKGRRSNSPLYLPTCTGATALVDMPVPCVLRPAPFVRQHHHRTWYNQPHSLHIYLSIYHARPHYCTLTSLQKQARSINQSSAVNLQPTAHGRSRPCAVSLSTCQSVSLSVSWSILVGQSPQYHRCTRRPTAWWENPILPRPDHSKSHLYTIRVALSAGAALTKAPSYWPRHNVVKPPGVFGWPANNTCVP